MSRSIRAEDDDIIIRLPRGDAQTLQVALAPIRQGQTTATTTDALRKSLIAGIAQALSKGR